jgi:NTE family protein
MSSRVKRAVVIGGGGVLGGTWAVGALSALERSHGFAIHEVDLLVGTSAGSVLAALLASGVSVDELVQHYSDHKVTSGPLEGYKWDPQRATGGGRPGSPLQWLPGSPGLLGVGLRNFGKIPATAVLSGLLPPGGKSLERVGHLIDAVSPMGGWVDGGDSPELWVVAMDYDSGKRVVFGRPGAPKVALSEAVMASCAIPGWFTPIKIGGRTYIDGGAISATSVDVVAEYDCEELYVIAPMAATESDRPPGIGAKLERAWRGHITRTAQEEIALVEATGAQVFFARPTPEDLTAIGANLMDSSRRLHVLETSLKTSAQTWERVS